MKLFTLLISLLVGSFSSIAMADFKTEKWLTGNGVQVVFHQAMEVPILDINLAFAAGSAHDDHQYGLSALTANMMNQGSAGKSVSEIADAMAESGAQFGIQNSKDMVVLSLRTLINQSALDSSVNTFRDILSRPDFPNKAFNREKEQLLMALKQMEESPNDMAGLSFFNTLYKGHPYAHPVEGTTKTVSAIKRDQVIDFYKKYYVANNATLVLVGAITSQRAHEIAEHLTHDLSKGEKAKSIDKALPLRSAEHIKIPFPSSQTIIRLGQIGIDHVHPDYFPLMVGNYILGGGALVSRLSIEVREKRGLTYGVDSQFIPMLGEGPFIINLSTKNEEASNALNITQETLDHFIRQGPNENELKAAKQYLMGSFPLALSGNKEIAGLLVRMSFYHLPDDYLDNYVNKINEVTVEDIKGAFQRHIHPDKLLLVTVGQL